MPAFIARASDKAKGIVDRNVRASYLVLKGSLYVLIGLGWVATETTGRVEGVGWTGFSTDTVGLAFVLAGVVAIVAGSIAEFRPRAEQAGFSALVFMGLVVSGWFAFSWLLSWAPGSVGASTGLISALNYLAFAISALVVSRASCRPALRNERADPSDSEGA